MMELYRLKCTTCHSGDPALSYGEIMRWHREIPTWEVRQVDGVMRLERIFSFMNFSQALSFANGVGKVAEEEHHHPWMLIEYHQVTLHWWTHKVKGLHINDFIMAAKIDKLFGYIGRANHAK
jgi:4a-hydroxytetrahydrobiopterin dehydratase